MDEWDGHGDLQAIYEARRRIVAAFEDISAGTEGLAERVAAAVEPATLVRLQEEVEEERTANAQLAERVRALHERGEGRAAGLEENLARAQARVEEVEARRDADRAEMDAVLAELIPLIEEAL